MEWSKLGAALLNSPIEQYWQLEYKPNDETISVAVIGSLISPVFDEKSDIDLAVFTKYTFNARSNYICEYEKQEVHWWYVSLKDILCLTISYPKTPVVYRGLYYYKFLQPEHFIYCHPDYQAVPSVILKYKDRIAWWGLCVLSHLIDFSLLEEGIGWNKLLWPYWDYYYDYVHKTKDEHYIDLSLKIKRNKLNYEERLEVLEGIKITYNLCLDYCKTHNIFYDWFKLLDQMHEEMGLVYERNTYEII